MDSISSFTKANDHMDLTDSNILPSTIDTFPNQTSHLDDTALNGYDRHAQLTSDSDCEPHGIASNLSSLTLSDQSSQHDRPLDRISKYTALREQKLNATLPTRFDSSSATQSLTLKAASLSSPQRIDPGSMKPDQTPLEIDAGHVHAMPEDNRSSQDSIKPGTHMKSDEGHDDHSSTSLHQANQGSLGLVQPPSRGNSDNQIGNRRSGGSIEQSRNIASTSTNLGNRRQNVTQQLYANSREEAIRAEQINHNANRILTDKIASLVPILPDGTHDIGNEILTYSSLCAPAPYVIKARQYMIEEITRRINSTTSVRSQSERPFQVVAFGSTQFNLDSNTSDLDLCICDPNLPRGPKRPQDILNPRRIYNMRTIGQILSQAGFKYVCPITSATVPIVKFCSPNRTIAADINCNNLLGCLNSALLKAYNDLSPDVFRPMGMAIKFWAKSRGICDPSGSLGPTTASSYTLILMLIGYLQSIGHLPNLQDEDYILQTIGHDPEKRTIISTLGKRPRLRKRKQPTIEFIHHDASFMVRPPPNTWEPKPIENLSVAFLGFFQYYDQFDFDNKVISIRSGKPCHRRTCPDSSNLEDEEDRDQESVEKSNLNVDTDSILENDLNQKENLDQEDTSDLKSEAEGSHLSNEVVTNEPEDGQEAKPNQSDRGSRRAKIPIPPDTPLYYSWTDPIATEDPFIRARNTSKNIRRSSAHTIKMEIKRARQILERGGGLVELCEWRHLMALRSPSPVSKSQNRSKGKEAERLNGKNPEPKPIKTLHPVMTTDNPTPSTSSQPAKLIGLPPKPSMTLPLPQTPKSSISNPQRQSKREEAERLNGKSLEAKPTGRSQSTTTYNPTPSTSSQPPKQRSIAAKPSMDLYPPLPQNPKRSTNAVKEPVKFSPSWYATMRRNKQRNSNMKPSENISSQPKESSSSDGKGKGKDRGNEVKVENQSNSERKKKR